MQGRRRSCRAAMEGNGGSVRGHATSRKRPQSARGSTSTSTTRRLPRLLSIALVSVSASVLPPPSPHVSHVCEALLPPFFTTQLWSSAAQKARATMVDIASPLGGDDRAASSTDVLRSPFGPSKANNANGVRTRNGVGVDGSSDAGPIQFAIERLDTNTDRDFREISEMCIGVFFDEMNNGGAAGAGGDFVVNGDAADSKNKATTPFKPMNLAYLRHLQYSDLRTRKFMSTQKNVMFIARRKIPAATRNGAMNGANGATKAVNGSAAENGSRRRDDCELGEVLGFVEVTARPFGLGRGDDLSETGRAKLRPVLANLAVKREARKSGVGSMLVEACEDAVLDWSPGYDEIILQVEEDNPRARRFYEKRGYQGLFSDPTCRRYNANSFILKQVRASKLCMRKDLKMKRLMRKGGGSSGGQNGVFGSKLFQVLKDAVSAGNR